MSNQPLKNTEQNETEALSLTSKTGPHKKAQKAGENMATNILPVVNPNEAKKAQRFNIEALAIPQGFNGYETEEVKTSVKVRKPGKQEFFKVLGTNYRMQTFALRLEKDKSVYLVDPELRPELASELILIEIFTVVTIRQEIFLWPIRIPSGDFDAWNRSALIAAREAQFKWVRITADLSVGEYRIQKAKSLDLEPQLPEESFEGLLKQAFQDHYIDSASHQVVKALRGEAE